MPLEAIILFLKRDDTLSSKRQHTVITAFGGFALSRGGIKSMRPASIAKKSMAESV